MKSSPTVPLNESDLNDEDDEEVEYMELEDTEETEMTLGSNQANDDDVYDRS